jgi:hypothetical protein
MRDESEVKQLKKLRDKYQEKANQYFNDYQIDGMSSQLRTYERNQRLADAITDALNGSKTAEKYYDLKYRIYELDTEDTEQLIKRVKYLQKQIEEGTL